MKHLSSVHLQNGPVTGRKRASGYAMFEALLVVAGIGTMAMASILLQDTLTKNQSRISIHSQLGEVRRLFLETLNNPTAWQNIVQNQRNGISNCLENAPAECLYLDPRPITAEVSSALGLKVDPERPELGFDLSLQGCDSFTATDENSPKCPFRAELGWKPICSAVGECKQIEVIVKIKANQGFENKYAFASDGYSFSLRKNMNLKNGTLNPSARILSFKADASAPKALKVFLIVDNSVSMADDRVNLAKGLESFVDGMAGFDVTYHVYTTDILFQGSKSAFPIGFRSVANLQTNGEYLLPDGSKVKGPFDWNVIPSNNFISWTGDIELRKDLSSRLGLNLRQTHDQTDMSLLKANLLNVMNAMEDPRANKEAGLCTLSHILNDEGPNMPIEEGDSAIFLLISDEDDSGFEIFSGERYICAKKTIVEQDGSELSETECNLGEPGCDDGINIEVRTLDVEKRIQYFKWRLIDETRDDNLTTCYAVGEPGKCGVVGTSTACTRADIPIPDPSPWVYANSCYETVERDSDDEDANLEKAFLDGGTMIPGKDYCTQSFTYKGVAYANAADYMVRAAGLDPAKLHPSGDCSQDGLDLQPEHLVKFAVMGSTYEPSTDFSNFNKFEKQMTDLYTGIPGRLRERFGSDGYGLYNVIHDVAKDAEAGCSVVAGESTYGTKYKQVLLASDTPGGLISVCKSDYSELLQDMKIKAQQIARDTYVLNGFNAETERVQSVQVERDGALILLTKSDYGISGTSLQFKAGFLQGQDNIQVITLPK